MRDALFVAWKDLRHALGLPQVWVWMLVMPLLLAYIVGSLMQSMAGSIERIAVYAPPDSGFLADEMARRLAASGYEVVRLGDAARLESYGLAVVVPAAFTSSVLNGPPAEIELRYPAGYRLLAWDRYRVGRAVDEMLADLIVLAKQGRTPDAAGFAALAAQPRKLELRVESAGEAKKVILGYQQSVPGFIVMFALQVSLTAGCVLLIAERKQGVLRRLAATPVSRASIVSGKLASRLVTGLIQVGVAMLAGRWWFRMEWGGRNLWAVLVLLAAYTMLCAALGLLFSSIARSESQALAAGVITANLLAAIGGCWWPVEITPVWMRHAALLLPTGWTMDGLHKLISYGAAPASVVPHVTALCGASLLAGWVAVRRFRTD
jgi:ABC-type multidrug transport system permease subunit